MYGRNHVLGYPPGYVMGYPPGYVMGYGGGGYGRPRRYGSLRGHVLGDGAMDTPALRAAIDFANSPEGQAATAAYNAHAQAQAMPLAMRSPMVQLVQPMPAPATLPANCDAAPTPGYTPPMSFRRPGWRDGMLAPGVPAPGEGLVMLPLTGSAGGVFTQGGAATQNFIARTQNPFKPVRLMFTADRLPAVVGGPTTPSRVLGQTFVGTRPQQAALGNINLESLGAPTSFGTDIDFDQAEPGVEIQLQTVLSTPLTIAGESIIVNTYFLGRWVA